jgi:DNA-binding NtrC family response regulator
MARILIAEDDRNTLNGLIEILLQEGYDTVGVDSGPEALKILERERFDILLTDLRMPEMDGMQLYDHSLSLAPEMKTIVMTAYSSVKEAVDAMKRGVYEYLTKPIDLDDLFIHIQKAISEQNLQKENEELKNRLQDSYRFENIIGKSEPMQGVYRIIEKVAKSNATVLIRGESGTGKELVARAIHYNSPRAEYPLVEISCASFPETLLESELFGYEKGAFTGATSRKIGRFEIAQGGTVFLDEIGEIAASVQVKLLHVLQERTFTRLGSTETLKVDVRLITATNRDLESALSEGAFREDLYYRLNVIPVFLPPLRDRKADIPLLVDHFIRKYCRANNRETMSISDASMDLCMAYDWPGNVRELENAIENAIVLSEGQDIQPENLPITLKLSKSAPNGINLFLKTGETFKEKVEAAEKIVLEDAIKNCNGNKSEAAKQLDISLRTMRYKIRKYGL